MKQERTRVEFFSLQYNTVGDLVIDWDTRITDMQRKVFDTVLEKTDKRLYGQYVDGCNIFELTPRQYAKFIRLLKDHNHPL